MTIFPWNARIAVLGAGDRGTAVALKLFHSGFQPILVETTHPTDLHFNRTFSDAVYQGKKTIENIQAAAIPVEPEQDVRGQVEESFANRIIPILSIPLNRQQDLLMGLEPEIIADCTRRLPQSAELNWQAFACVIRVGFQFNVGVDGHFVIGDTNPYCGMVFQTRHELSPETTGTGVDDLYKAPIEGIFLAEKRIGDHVVEREKIGTINSINILAPSTGIIEGLLHSGHHVQAGQPLFELVSTKKFHNSGLLLPVRCRTIAGGILEAVLKHLYQIRK